MSNDFNNYRSNSTFFGSGQADLWEQQKKLSQPKNYDVYGAGAKKTSATPTPVSFDFTTNNNSISNDYTPVVGVGSVKADSNSKGGWIFAVFALLAVIIFSSHSDKSPTINPYHYALAEGVRENRLEVRDCSINPSSCNTIKKNFGSNTKCLWSHGVQIGPIYYANQKSLSYVPSTADLNNLCVWASNRWKNPTKQQSEFSKCLSKINTLCLG